MIARAWMSALIAFFAAASVADACPFSFREAGFIAPSRAPYIIFFFHDNETPGRECLVKLDEIAAGALYDSNVRAKAVNLSDDENAGAAEWLKKAGADALPSAVLAAPNGEAIPIEIPGGKMSAESVKGCLESAVASPMRAEVRDNLIKPWCVCVLRQCGDKALDDAAADAVKEAVKGIVGAMSEMGKVIEKGPHMIIVPPDGGKENLFLRAIGLGDGKPAAPALAVLFGRGKRFGPALKGDDITRQNVEGFFQMLGRNCACTTNPIWFAGPTAPLRWGEALEGEVRKELGYDPASPLVQMELSGVASIELAREAEGRVEDLGLDDFPLLGYREVPVDFNPDGQEGQDGEAKPDAEEKVAVIPDDGPVRPVKQAEPPVADIQPAAILKADNPQPGTAPVRPQLPAADANLSKRAGRNLFVAAGILVIIVATLSLMVFRRRGPQ
ncbi:MAG TPA: hypothetical protein PL033_06210 [Candidatus Brocadiia bacterium]|nr:hypothetical protein [Candidatus Brocadiia bacterium]